MEYRLNILMFTMIANFICIIILYTLDLFSESYKAG